MSEASTLFAILRQSADRKVVDCLDYLVQSGSDRELNRINVLAFAADHGFDEEAVIATFLHAARINAFDLAWNVLCPGCGGVLDTSATLRSVKTESYHCSLCAAGYQPTLDEMVEVTFTVNPRLRRIAAHQPDSLPPLEYYRQVFFSSGVDLSTDFEGRFSSILLEMLELNPGERAIISVTLPSEFVIVFDAVTHATQFIDVQGEPTHDRQTLSVVISRGHTPNETITLRPGPLRLTLENHTDRRVIPNVCVAGEELHHILGHRRPFLTANRMLTNQTFRDIFRADTLSLDQRMKITSLTFLFTDLKGSTNLYERVGDLAAFDLVRAHFEALLEIVGMEGGAVVKTIGDAVMATFPTPNCAVAAALRMRDAMTHLNLERGREDLLLKIGVHEGPCLAVSLNDRQDYFGQSVNIASRVQGLADTDFVLVTEPVVRDLTVESLLKTRGIEPQFRPAKLRGIDHEVRIYALKEIPSMTS